MNAVPLKQSDDASLVAESLAGNREAFGQIVVRYQTLICSLAYSGTGSLSQSEDLAQETFIAAWKQLANLRQPHKLRAWLCGIARNLIYDVLQKQGREPIHAAEPFDVLRQAPAPEPQPHIFAISKEEAAILWCALERIPEFYREPLILFYREHQSVERVAANLELSEDAVKQRLSRGRKLLQEQVLAFVEGALVRTNPGQAFTLAVLATLPALTISAKAAAMGAAAKGSAAAKGAGLMGLLGAFLCPLLAFLNLFGVYRLNFKEARSDRERRLYNIYFPVLGGSIVVDILLVSILISHGDSLIKTSPSLFVGLVAGLVLGYPLLLIPFCVWFGRAVKKLNRELPADQAAAKPKTPFSWEYRSRFQLLGLPFIHIRVGGWGRGWPARKLRPVKAWIAADDAFAVGILFAYGSVAVAPVSIGACTLGLFSYGAMAVGALSVGGFSFGIWAFGAFAFGWQASAACAIAWNIASGGQYAIAHQFAWAPTAHAAQANTEFVKHLVRSNPFLETCWRMVPYFFWLMWAWAIPIMIVMVVQWLGIARRHRQKVANN